MELILKRYKGGPAHILAQIRKGNEQELEEYVRLQTEVRDAMPDPDLFMPNTREELLEMLRAHLCIGVWVENRLMAFVILRYCGLDAHNYAAVLGLPESDRIYWANADSAAVHPDLRGNGLQYRLLLLAEQWRDPSIVGVCGTISPENPYSLRNAQAAGYQIAARREMYGGHDRYILQKHLAPLPGVYRHFKGAAYQVLGLAKHSENEETMVIYRALYGQRETWVRPVSMWFEHVERDGYSGPRFVWAAEEN